MAVVAGKLLLTCTLYFCFQLQQLNLIYNVTPSTNFTNYCHDEFRVPLVSEVIVLYDEGKYLPKNQNHSFIVQHFNGQHQAMNVYVYDDEIDDHPAYDIRVRRYAEAFITHKMCVLKRSIFQRYKSEHPVFVIIALITLGVFACIIFVYLIILITCLCHQYCAEGHI